MTNPAGAAAIRRLIDDWVDAICKGDMDRVLRHRAGSIVMFDVPAPIQNKGLDAYRATWKLFFDHNPPGPELFRISELTIFAGEDAGFAHGLLTIGGGQAHCRLTLGLVREADDWRVVHEHHSMPLSLQ